MIYINLALRCVICEIGTIFEFFSASTITWLGMDGHTLDMINLFAGFISLHI